MLHKYFFLLILLKVGVLGNFWGPRIDDFAPSCVRMERLEVAKSPNLGPKRCPIIATLGKDKMF